MTVSWLPQDHPGQQSAGWVLQHAIVRERRKGLTYVVRGPVQIQVSKDPDGWAHRPWILTLFRQDGTPLYVPGHYLSHKEAAAAAEKALTPPVEQPAGLMPNYAAQSAASVALQLRQTLQNWWRS